MLKVMDPNVHQMVLNTEEVPRMDQDSDEDYVATDRDPVQKH